jgi:hypothetical protein
LTVFGIKITKNPRIPKQKVDISSNFNGIFSNFNGIFSNFNGIFSKFPCNKEKEGDLV